MRIGVRFGQLRVLHPLSTRRLLTAAHIQALAVGTAPQRIDKIRRRLHHDGRGIRAEPRHGGPAGARPSL